MKKIATAVVVFMAIGTSLFAQQQSEFTQYMFNGLSLNPAYAGSREAISAVAIGRYQWVDIDGAPKTMSLGVHSPVREKVGLGLYAEYDQIGVHDRIEVYGSYSYRFLIGRGKLSAGIQAGVENYRSAWTDLNPQSLNDPNFTEDQSVLLPNFGLGLYYYTNRFYVGFSIPQLINNKLNDNETGSKLARQERHYYLTSGIVLPLGEQFKLKPSALLKSVPQVAPLELDINLSLVIRDVFTVGATYRTQDSFDFLASIQLNRNLRFGYAYDLTTTELKNYTSGSHEVMIGYDFGFSKERVVTPRYF